MSKYINDLMITNTNGTVITEFKIEMKKLLSDE
jgi:hypothetical protein